MIPNTSLFVALIGGIGPAIIWLLFWLQEDREHPEPRIMILLTFLVGMICVPAVIPFQKYALASGYTGSMLLFWWALTEEVFKFVGAYLVALRTRFCDEPIDYIMYMVVIALGFAAAENSLFLLNPTTQSSLAQGIITGNFRFMGASLLHVLASASIGITLAFSYYKSKMIKIEHALSGLILAVGLHTLFNVLILKTADAGVLRTFALVWFGIVAVFALCEYVKHRVRPLNRR